MSEKEYYKIVRKMYIAYTLSTIFPFLSHLLNTERGFCHYLFLQKINPVNVLSFIIDETKMNPGNKGSYWYKPGDVKPRRKLLRKAIKNYKLSLKQ